MCIKTVPYQSNDRLAPYTVYNMHPTDQLSQAAVNVDHHESGSGPGVTAQIKSIVLKWNLKF